MEGSTAAAGKKTEPFDLARSARTVIQWVLTVGAALVYAVLVTEIAVDIWSGTDPVAVDDLRGGVMNSLALTFGSAFVGWFGISAREATIDVTAASGFTRRWEIFAGLMTELAGAAVFAMVVYLAAGALAGITYLFNQDVTPTLLITVATAWAAQASAVVAATLAAVLKPSDSGRNAPAAAG